VAERRAARDLIPAAGLAPLPPDYCELSSRQRCAIRQMGEVEARLLVGPARQFWEREVGRHARASS